MSETKKTIERLSKKSKIIYAKASDICRDSKRTLNDLTLLLALVRAEKEKIFSLPEISLAEIKDIEEILGIAIEEDKDAFANIFLIHQRGKAIFKKATIEAAGKKVEPIHLLLGILCQKDTQAAEILEEEGITEARVRSILKQEEEKTNETADEELFQVLCRDITQEAREDLKKEPGQRKLFPLIGRDYEVFLTEVVLGRLTKGNPCLVGEPGVGKTAIPEGLAQILVSDKCPPAFRGVRLLELPLGTLVAGTRFRGDLEERVQKLIAAVKRSAGKIILFIDEAHQLVGGGAAVGGIDIANLLKPALAKGEVRAVLATTPREFHLIEKDGALARRIISLRIEEPSIEETIKILQGLKIRFETHHGVDYTDKALEAAAKLSARYIFERFLPDKAIDLIDEAGSAAKLTGEKKLIIDEEQIAQIVSRKTGIPVKNLTEEEKDRLLRMEEELAKRVIGQDEAVRVVSEAVRRVRAGISDPNRPNGVFLFLGPTGVGKTQTARSLAEFLFFSQEAMTRVDMSEYMESHSVSRLIGAPPGYVGYEEGGQLTEKIRQRPYSIILLDEIEKAHPRVLNVLLQVFDDGRLTDGQGRIVNFKNTIIIMTSNIGGDLFLKEDHERACKAALSELKIRFAPEFLNRIDEIVAFHSLALENQIEIIDLFLVELNERLKEKALSLRLEKGAKEFLAVIGFDPCFGARPLKRVIQREIENPLALAILRGNFKRGDKIEGKLNKSKIEFSIE